MNSGCISNCINDARDPRVPMRGSYVNLYKWPESDAAFVRSVSSGREHPKVVDSISCRQLYLRSYTFCREDEKKKKVKVNTKKRVVVKKKILGGKKDKKSSCSVWFGIFRRFLSCCASVDVCG
ncbi:hypothetical protein RYX36_031508 [Vicia faba]